MTWAGSQNTPASPLTAISTPVSSSTSRAAAPVAVSPGSIAPPGSSQLPVSIRRASRIRPPGSRTTAKASATTTVAGGGSPQNSTRRGSGRPRRGVGRR